MIMQLLLPLDGIVWVRYDSAHFLIEIGLRSHHFVGPTNCQMINVYTSYSPFAFEVLLVFMMRCVFEKWGNEETSDEMTQPVRWIINLWFLTAFHECNLNLNGTHTQTLSIHTHLQYTWRLTTIKKTERNWEFCWVSTGLFSYVEIKFKLI